MYEDVVSFIKALYANEELIQLHEPRFRGNEKKYLNEAIDSSYVSSTGEFVDRFEKQFAEYTGSKYAVATVNGTAALHVALNLAGVGATDEVITQPLTFVATCNAISYCGALPLFIDVDKDTLGLSPSSLQDWLEKNATMENNCSYNKNTGNKISACVPMHTFGLPCRIDEIKQICRNYQIPLIEDAAEALGSYLQDRHAGTFGEMGVFSFNGNKVITSGGGGMIVTDDHTLAEKAKAVTTTAKQLDKWQYTHDQVAFNYRLPNINAALGCAQLEQLPGFLQSKKELAAKYKDFFKNSDIEFISPVIGSTNHWLNSLVLKNREERDKFLQVTNENGIATRPVWKLMNELPMFNGCGSGDLSNAEWLEARVVNIPSSVI